MYRISQVMTLYVAEQLKNIAYKLNKFVLLSLNKRRAFKKHLVAC